MTKTATNEYIFNRGDQVVYLGDDAHRGNVGIVTRYGVDAGREPTVEVTFREGRRSYRKSIRVSLLERVEVVS